MFFGSDLDVNLEVLSELYLGLKTATLDLSHQTIRLTTARTDSRPCTVCDVINFSAQKQLCDLSFVGARNLSNHAKASSKPLFANLNILDVFSIYSVHVSSFMYQKWEMRPSKFPRPKTLNKNKEKGGEEGERKVKMPRSFNPKYRNFPSCTHLTPFLNASVIATFIDQPIKTRVTCIRNHRSKPIHSLTFLSLC